MSYKVKLVSDEYGVEEFTYDTITEQRLGAARLQIAAHEHYTRDGIYREVVICIGEDDEDAACEEFPLMSKYYGEEVEPDAQTS